eukprot:4716156-Pyramimonas_sp.AAC.1
MMLVAQSGRAADRGEPPVFLVPHAAARTYITEGAPLSWRARLLQSRVFSSTSAEGSHKISSSAAGEGSSDAGEGYSSSSAAGEGYGGDSISVSEPSSIVVGCTAAVELKNSVASS